MSAEAQTKETVKTCVSILKTAKTDTEKFAALLIVAKLVKADEVDSTQRSDIFNAVGWTFLQRLLHTDEVPDGCTENMFRSIALSVLSAFCKDAVICVTEMLEEIDIFKEVISNPPTCLIEEEMVDDALQCILHMAMQENGWKCIIEKKIHHNLIDIYIHDSQGQELALHILALLARSKSEMWSFDPAVFSSFMSKLAETFHQEHSIKKFELCQMLTDILLKYPHCRSYLEEPWCLVVREALCSILQSKLCKELRDPALNLASVMMEKFGSQWLLEESKDSKKFFALLVNLVCIEVQMILDERNIDDVVNDSVVLTACYSILETSISMMVDDSLWHWNESNTEQLLVAVKDAFNAIIKFLLDLSKNWEVWKTSDTNQASRVRELMYASFRILCCWLAEETLALREEVYKVLPFLMKISKYSFHATKDVNEQMFSMAPISIDVMRFMIPALCHLSADDDARKILLAERADVMLHDYLQYQWNVLLKASGSEELCVMLSTICGIFLNIVVLEGKYISENETFFQLLKFLFASLPQLASATKYLQLRANFAVLGLLICGHYHRRIILCETSFYKFLSSSVKFLWDAHHVEDANDAKSFVLAREYRKVWHDIMELWFLGMQALSSLLSLIPWISTFLLESGWPQHITTQLSYVPEPHIEGSIKTAYQHFLCCVVRTCPEATEELLKYEIIKVCRVHKLKELESLVL